VSNIHLKIKIKTLASEASFIRAEEHKLRARTTYHRKQVKAATENSDEQKRHRRAANWTLSDRMDLMDHRKGVVRSAARTNLLAYGFLRGRSYEQMERYSEEEPDWIAIEKVVKRFDGTKIDEFEQWEIQARTSFRRLKKAS
jgi:hypothetical protein